MRKKQGRGTSGALHRLIRSKGYTLADVAKRLGLHPKRIGWKIARGRTIKLGELEVISAMLDVPINDVMRCAQGVEPYELL